jgi:hypothetical protein
VQGALAIALAMLALLSACAVALGQGLDSRTVSMAFELLGDPAQQHYHDVGPDGSVRYGIGRVTGDAELDGRPVDVASEFTIRYVDGSGPFSGWLTITDEQGGELGFAYEGYTVRDEAGSRIEGVLEVTGGSGAFIDVTGTGRMTASRSGPVGTATRYELTLELAGLPAAVGSSAPVFSDRSAAGLDLFTAYSDLLVAKDIEALRELLDPAFLIVRGDGSFAGRDAYLANLPDLRRFALSDVEEVRSEDGAAIRMMAEAELTVDGKPFRADPAPMLAAFRWDDGRWRLVAQGNFNVPGR